MSLVREPTQTCTLCGRVIVVTPDGRGFPPDIAKRKLEKACNAEGCPSKPQYRAGFQFGGPLVGQDDTSERIVRAEIDPNVRVRDNETFVGFEDLDGMVNVGDPVEVFESESGARGTAVVSQILYGRRTVFLDVNWAGLTTPRGGS